jgi:probable F420-dependent oxidoreductase
MAHPRRFRFGIQLASAPDARSWTESARRAEQLGYSTLFVPDHFGDQLAPIAALAAAATVTTELRVGALVFDNDYRHPLVLAKELATLDLLSDGRVEVGLGAGWMKSDYDESGIEFDRAGTRVDRFEEGLQIVKGLFRPEPFSFAGEHYTITDHVGTPRPVQSPPPILIGAGLERMLGIAGRHADIVGINPTIPNGVIDNDAVVNGLAEATDEKLGWLRAAAGDRYDDLEINLLNFACIVTDDRAGTAEAFAPAFGLTTDQLLAFPHALIGTVEEIAESLIERRERFDASYVVVQLDALETFAPVVARLAGT